MRAIVWTVSALIALASASNANSQSIQDGFDAARAGDMARAAAIYQKVCARGEALGCFHFGVLTEHGWGVTTSPAKAAPLYRQACTGKIAQGCTSLGYLYDEGTGVKKNAVLAATLYQQGCDGGDAVGCLNLGLDYENGDGVGKDRARALALYRKALELNPDASHASAIQEGIARLSTSAAAPAPAAAAPAGQGGTSNMVRAPDPQSLVNAMQADSDAAKLVTDSTGDPMIESAVNGMKYFLVFYGCTDHQRCTRIQFRRDFTMPQPLALDRLNEWNGKTPFAHASNQPNGNAMLEMDLDLSVGGMPAPLFIDNVHNWKILMPRFVQFAGYRGTD